MGSPVKEKEPLMLVFLQHFYMYYEICLAVKLIFFLICRRAKVPLNLRHFCHLSYFIGFWDLTKI